MIMKKLGILTFIILLVSTMAWGQTITGTGTALDPYVLNSDDDWDVVTKNEDTYWGPNVYIKLGTDISAGSAFVGYKDKIGVIHSYKGHFDGDWHKLTFDLGSEAPYYNEDYAAPFSYVDGAKISNLTVDGMITTTAQYAGTIVGYVSNTSSPTELTSCTSECYITCYREGRAYHGGMIGRVANGEVVFKWCIFNGTIIGEHTTHCAGFVGYVNGKGDDGKGSVSYKYCTMAYANVTLASDFATFNILGSATEAVFDGHTYYTRHYEDDGQGIQAPTREPDDQIAKKYSFAGNATTYYVPEADIEELDTRVIYGGTIKPNITYYGKELINHTDYNAGADIDVGTLKIQGINGYGGSVTITDLNIVDISTWAKLKTELYKDANKDKKKIFVLTENLSDNTSAGPLKMRASGEVILDLNDCTLNRGLYNGNNSDNAVKNGHAVEIEQNVVVTIIGPGIIKGGNNTGHGGGIRCSGRLTLNNVTVSENSSKDRGGGVYLDSNSKNCYIEGGVIDHNWSTSGGGGVFSQGTNFKMKNVHVEYNKAHSKGGGLRLETSGNITDCYFDHNTLLEHDAADGGGVWSKTSGNVFTRCTFTTNNAYRYGGAYYLIAGSVTFKDCDIEHNSSLTDGGGIFVYEGTIILDGTKVMNNSSNATGGVFLNCHTTVKAEHNTTLQIKGATIISMNNGDATKMNLFIDKENGKIEVVGDLTNDAFICLSRRDNPGIVTTNLNKYAGDINNFRSDNYKMYWLNTTNGEISLQNSLYWDQPDGWSEFIIKKDNDYIIMAPIIIPNGVIAKPNSITYVEPGIIFIEDGGQLEYSGTSVPATVLKNILAATKEEDAVTGGWYSIATPVTNLKLSGDDANTNLITAQTEPYNFDLLRYNEGESLWESYNNPAHVDDFKTLEVGRGYLYRNSKSLTIEYTGNLKTGSVPVDLSYSPSTAHSGLAGWNLIGNPYTHDIIKGDGNNCAIENGDLLATGFYRLTNSGAWDAKIDDGAVIKPGEGILVKVKTEKPGTHTLTINNKNVERQAQRSNKEYLKFTVANSNYDDATYAVFDEGDGLPKINHRNADIPMVYINQDAENYAIAMINDDVKSFDLNFKAMKTGQYTLSCEKDGDFSYLHVIDKLAGRDIDMLLDEKYTFIGSPRDTDARFVVRLSYNGGAGENDEFAYQNGDDIVVCGEGELQVYDVLGRFVTSKRINGVETINLDATGVYILRLIGEEIHTQKMVVR